MREIKFRAWIEDYKEMTYSRHYNYLSHFFSYLEDCYLEEQYVIQQFTGLYDKNGKEIYEGDILQWTSSNPFSLGEIRKVKVYYVEARFWCNTWNNKLGIYLGELLSEEKCEVIGNIYENPDLINQQ